MSYLLRRIFLSCLFITAIMSGEITGKLKIAILRVSFVSDTVTSTTGNGTFLLVADTVSCTNYPIDPAPHDESYFYSQLNAVNHYYQTVSHNLFGLDIDRSIVFPRGDTASYQLTQSMSYYHPYGVDEEVQEKRLVELFRDAVLLADTVNYNDFDLITVVHAGIGQDFALPFLDPSPEDIPSTYVDRQMIADHLGSDAITVNGTEIEHGIIIPETQNHLLYSDAKSIFADAEEPCDYQYGLTGTFSLMIGFAIGLPPLWDTERGESGIGVFGLMDQGSNNGRGLIPAPPDAWSRIFAGWEEPKIVKSSITIGLPTFPSDSAVKIPINSNEYFLLENRTNWVEKGVSIDSIRYAIWEETDRYPPFIEILFDRVNLEKDSNGVVVAVPDYDLGLPASGLLIWHIDETVINAGITDYSINNNRLLRGVDLEEADGAQDIGFPSIFLFTDPSAGYFGDMWFKGNQEYVRSNPDYEGSFPAFSPFTYPDTRANSGASTFITIENISAPDDTMMLSISNSFMADGFPDTTLYLQLLEDFTGDGIEEIMGGGDSLWWSPVDTINKHSFYRIDNPEYKLLTTNYDSLYKTLVLAAFENDSIRVKGFNYNYNQGIFLLNWSQTSYYRKTGHIYGYKAKNQVTIDYIDSGYDIYPDRIEYWTTDDSDSGIIPNQRVFTQNVFNGQEDELTCMLQTDSTISLGNSASFPDLLKERSKFSKLSAVDLDLDGKPEFLALSATGYLYVFNDNLSLESGFPIYPDASGTILARNLFGDEHPELVAQNSSGEVLIYDWKGNEEYRLANPKENKIQLLADYFGKSSIITESSIFVFDSVASNNGNEWVMEDADNLRTRQMLFSQPVRVVDESMLIDKKKTYCYPNPARRGLVTLRVFVESADVVEINIYDISGFYVTDLKMDNPVQGEANELVWQVDKIESGVYFADVTAKKGSQTESKIIKIAVIH